EQLRKSAIMSLKNISHHDKKQIENKLAENLMNSTLWKQAETIGITMAQEFEWSTKPIIKEAWNNGKTICVPKCNPQNKQLTFYQLQDFNQLEIVYYNLLEPKPEETEEIVKSNIDLLVVPGIVFDKRGFRIGFGGGYYDRFLTDFSNKTVSIISTMQLRDHLPNDSFDIPVNHIITENGIVL